MSVNGTRTVPHPRWPGRKITPRDARERREYGVACRDLRLTPGATRIVGSAGPEGSESLSLLEAARAVYGDTASYTAAFLEVSGGGGGGADASTGDQRPLAFVSRCEWAFRSRGDLRAETA